MAYLLLSLVLCLGLFSRGGFAQELISIDRDFVSKNISPSFVYHKTESELSPEAVLHIPDEMWISTKDSGQFQVSTKGKLWFKFRLSSTSESQSVLIFDKVVNSQERMRAFLCMGETCQAASQYENIGNLAFSLSLPVSSQAYLLVEFVSTAERTGVSFLLRSLSDHLQKNFVTSALYAVLLGFISVLFFYNLIQLFIAQEVVFLWYCVYLLGLFSLNATVVRLFGSWSHNLMCLSTFTVIIGLFLFQSHLLYEDTKRRYLRLYSLAYTPSLVTVILCLFKATKFPSELLNASIAGAYFIAFINALYHYRRKTLYAAFFVLAWASVLIAFVFFAANRVYWQLPFGTEVVNIGILIEILIFSSVMSLRSHRKQAQAIRSKSHILSELRKIVFPHQLSQMANKTRLEETLPTSLGQACILKLTIEDGSFLQHAQWPQTLQKLQSLWYERLIQDYDSKTMSSSGYRIKELSDGVLCAIGYPFATSSGNPVQTAYTLALDFHDLVERISRELDAEEAIRCHIALSWGPVQGFFPKVGIQEYDLQGLAIVHATRYRAMANDCARLLNTKADLLVLQATVYHSLPRNLRESFVCLDLAEAGLFVRDDPKASQLYVREIKPSQRRSEAA